MLSQGKDDNEAGWEKDKQETVNLDAREYIFTAANNCRSIAQVFFAEWYVKPYRHFYVSFRYSLQKSEV